MPRIIDKLVMIGATLKSIEVKLDRIQKYIGFFVIFIFTPVALILGFYGIDLQNYFKPVELTERQKEFSQKVQALGYKVDAASSLRTLRERSPLFVEYLSEGITPPGDATNSVIVEFIKKGETLPGNRDLVRSFISNISSDVKDSRGYIESVDSFINNVSNAKFSSYDDFCRSAKSILNGSDFWFSTDGIYNCMSAFISGDIGPILDKIVVSAKYWNYVFGINRKFELTDQDYLNVVGLPERSGDYQLRAVSLFSENVLSTSFRMKVYRFKVNVVNASKWFDAEQEGAYRLGIQDQTGPNDDDRSVVATYADDSFSIEKMHEACDAFGRLNTCILDFSVAIDRGRFFFIN
jgi:hypothetical protein